MSTSLDLFLPTRHSLCGILITTFEVFHAEGRVFILLGAASWLLTSIVKLVVGVIFALVYSKDLLPVLEDISKQVSVQDEGSRFLVAHGTGSGILSRFLLDAANNNYTGIISDDNIEHLKDMLAGFIVMVIILTVVILFISSCFQGAIIASVSDVYCRRESSFRNSFSIGWTTKTEIFCYQLMFYAGFIVIIFLAMLLAMLLAGGFFGILMLFSILFYAARFAVGEPSILLEKKSSFHAFSRSWDLSKGSICKIICTLCLYNLGFFVVFFIISYIPVINLILLLSHIITMPLGTILITVIYMSRRIEVEGMTMADLMKDVPIATVIALNDMHERSTTDHLKEKGQFKQVNSEDFV